MDNDPDIIQAIADAFGKAKLSAKTSAASSDVVVMHEADEDDEEDECLDEDAECQDDPAPVNADDRSLGMKFRESPNIGPFKAQFCLYYLSKLAISRRVRFEALAELDKTLVAGWGTGLCLSKLCSALAPDLPKIQDDDSERATRKCTILLALLFYSKLGDAMARVLRPHYIRNGTHWDILHLEFVLCEVRKAAVKRAKKIRARPSKEMLRDYENCTFTPKW